MALRQAPRSSHERKVSDLWTSFAPTFVAGAMEQAERRGAQLLVASFPSLDRPFSEQLQWNREMYGPVLEALAAEGVPIIEMDRALLPHDPVDVRADTCCHYNPAGVQIVSQLLAGPIAESLRAGSASRASGGPIDSAARPAR